MATNQEVHFSSPEKIAQIIAHVDCRYINDNYAQAIATGSKCQGCPLIGYCLSEDKTLEWLQEECE